MKTCYKLDVVCSKTKTYFSIHSSTTLYDIVLSFDVP